MDPIESEGATVAEAVEAVLRDRGLRREQVEVTVLSEGAPGFMGLGAKPARVRLSLKRWGSDPPPETPPAARTPAPAPARAPRGAGARSAPPPARPPRGEEAAPSRAITPSEAAAACAKVQELLTALLRGMTIAAPAVTASWDADMERVKAVVESQDATLLVGRDGRVLESLQFLATLMMSRGAETPIAVQVDALSYWEKRETAILDQARNAAESVKATGRPQRLEPMDASMRRLIHRTFASSPDVTTASEGEGPWRKIVLRPRTR